MELHLLFFLFLLKRRSVFIFPIYFWRSSFLCWQTKLFLLFQHLPFLVKFLSGLHAAKSFWRLSFFWRWWTWKVNCQNDLLKTETLKKEANKWWSIYILLGFSWDLCILIFLPQSSELFSFRARATELESWNRGDYLIYSTQSYY